MFFLLVVVVLPGLVFPFNLDHVRYSVVQGGSGGQFGASLAATATGFYVGAPGEGDKGAVYQCDVTGMMMIFQSTFYIFLSRSEIWTQKYADCCYILKLILVCIALL